MNERTHTTLRLTLDEAGMSSFVPLLQKGVHVRIQVGRSMEHLLCEQCGINPAYLAERIQTIFLDGKVVDNVGTTTVRDGGSIALSAAMPGLAGATLRTGGLLAAFRDGLTHEDDGASDTSHEEGFVTIKLFNLLVRELGPLFLKKGIWMTKQDVENLVNRWADISQPLLQSVEKDGQEMSPDQLAGLDWSREPERVFFKVTGWPESMGQRGTVLGAKEAVHK